MVVRMRHTRAHTRNRRSHHALEGPRLSKCEKCFAMRLNHRMCLECGWYKGIAVKDVAAKNLKREKRIKEKMRRLGREDKKEEVTKEVK